MGRSRGWRSIFYCWATYIHIWKVMMTSSAKKLWTKEIQIVLQIWEQMMSCDPIISEEPGDKARRHLVSESDGWPHETRTKCVLIPDFTTNCKNVWNILSSAGTHRCCSSCSTPSTCFLVPPIRSAVWRKVLTDLGRQKKSWQAADTQRPFRMFSSSALIQ